jgi:hypothetical protein
MENDDDDDDTSVSASSLLGLEPLDLNANDPGDALHLHHQHRIATTMISTATTPRRTTPRH